MLLATEYSFTKEQLFADLQSDGIHASLDLLERAKRGSSEAFYDIGVLYISKEDNQSKILAWFLLSANKSNPEAQYHIGLMYHYGQNVPIDYLIAMEWYLKAAKQYHLRACLEIGYLYRNGYGVPANEHRAFQWFCKSKSMSRDRETTIATLIKESEEIVRIEKENKKTLDDLKTLRLKQQQQQKKDDIGVLRQSILTAEQELLNKDLTINILKKENKNIQNTLYQETQKKDTILKQFEMEKQQILTQLDRSTQESNKKIQYLTQHNISMMQKVDVQDKVVSQLRNENHNLQTLLKWYQEKENQQHYLDQANSLQKLQRQDNLQYKQVNNESKLLQESDSENDSSNNHLPEQEKKNMLYEIKSLKDRNIQFEIEIKTMKKKIVMLETINQTLRDSADQVTKLSQHFEKSTQNWTDMVQDKQKIFDEIKSLKQSNVCLEQESKHMKEKIESLENVKHIDANKKKSFTLQNVTQISEADEITAIINELKQKDRKLKKLESQIQALQVLYEQKMFEAHEMLKAVSTQNEDTIQSLEEENQRLIDEVQEKALCERKLESKNKKIELLQVEIERLKQSRDSWNQEMLV